MAAATPESGGSGGPFHGIVGRHFGWTGEPEAVAAAATPKTVGYSLLVEGVVVATSRPIIIKAVTSLSAAGAVTLTNAVAGDAVVSVTDLSSDSDVTSSFESTISVSGQIQQSASTSGHSVLVVVQPQS